MVREEEGKSKANSSVGGDGGADGGSEDQEHLRTRSSTGWPSAAVARGESQNGHSCSCGR
jgi:hypothetical protein